MNTTQFLLTVLCTFSPSRAKKLSGTVIPAQRWFPFLIGCTNLRCSISSRTFNSSRIMPLQKYSTSGRLMCIIESSAKLARDSSMIHSLQSLRLPSISWQSTSTCMTFKIPKLSRIQLCKAKFGIKKSSRLIRRRLGRKHREITKELSKKLLL